MDGQNGRFEAGLELRREVLGASYVDAAMERSSEFLQTFQRITTEWCWGFAWTRPGLTRKERSMINIAMLTALNRPNEVRLHVRGALNNGVSVEQIREVLVQATVYCGIPAGLDAFKIADEVLTEAGLVDRQGSGSTTAE
ncbi:MAG: carboxymuconolactone decarboxylase family protein [Geminicoccaceae bacterium]